MDSINLPPQGTVQFVIIGALITVTVGTLFKPVGKAILKTLLFPFKPIFRIVYLWITPRNFLSIPFKCYKRSIGRSNLSRIENPVGPPIQIPLEHAFAPLKLVSKTQPEGVELFSMTARVYRMMLLGGPGSGKTTLMKSLLSAILHKRSIHELNELIPVFIVLRRLSSENYTVKQAIISMMKDHGYPRADRFVDASLSQGRMLIILDGLDEVGANRSFVIRKITEFCEEDSIRTNKNRVIVTCREASYRSEDLREVIPDVVKVEPFGNHHIRIFLQGWPLYKDRTALKLYGMIQDDPQIRDICRTPLLLTILTGLYLDTDQFELPTSRELFYKCAVDELLIKRPARRCIEQKIGDVDKRRILERTSFRKLQSLQTTEDAEVFSREAIVDVAKEIIGRPFDAETLINELVSVNGIIKFVDNDIFTCAHRTFQEYFAAREATRILKTEELLETFGSRRDLSEVLYFSCGLIHNIPQLQGIAQWCIDRNDWNSAAKCLLHMAESPGNATVLLITKALCRQIKDGDLQTALELLSSLGQRPDRDFDIARGYFYEAVNSLTTQGSITGLAAIGTTLSTRPDVAMKVIPVLLAHPSEEWQRTAVRLLRDIGTDEALDRLVQLLATEPGPVLEETGNVLADILKFRQSELLQRIKLFPEVEEDKNVWPLNKFIPSRIALPIASAAAESDGATGNKLIDCAAAVIRKRNGLGCKAYFNERHWRNLSRHYAINSIRRRVSGKLFWISCGLMGIYLLIALAFNMTALIQKKIIFIDSKLKIISLPWEPFEKTNRMGVSLVKAIKRQYPPNAAGIARILPWNWVTEPVLPHELEGCYNQLYDLSDFPTSLRLLVTMKYQEEENCIDILKQSNQKIVLFYRLIRQNALNIPSVYYLCFNIVGFLFLFIVITTFLLNLIFMWRSNKINLLQGKARIFISLITYIYI